MTAAGPPTEDATATPGPPPAAESAPATSPAPAPPVNPAVARANRMNAANMLRSLLPLVVICLVIVGFVALRQNPQDTVREVDPATTVALAAARAGYPLLVPTGLPSGYRPTSARTDAGAAGDGDPVTLELGYLTPSEEFAGFVVGDNPRAAPLRAVLDGANPAGVIDIGEQTWTRATTGRGETAFIREVDGVTAVVTGSADDAELTAVAAAVGPYDG